MNNTTGSGESEKATWLYVVTGLLLLESAVIVLTNMLVYVLFTKTKKLRRKNNYCLISLATSDLLVGLVISPLVIACNWYGSRTSTCVAMDISHRFTAICTILHILLATGERFFKIHFPLRYHVYVTCQRIVSALVTVWVVSLTISLLMLAFEGILYFIVCMVLVGCLPFLVILVVNVHTIWAIDRNSDVRTASVENEERDQRRKRKQRRAMVVYLAMAVSFAVGSLPYFILPLLLKVPLSLSIILLLLKFCTSFVNPLLYTFFKTDFKLAFKNLTGKEESKHSRATHLQLLSRRCEAV